MATADTARTSSPAPAFTGATIDRASELRSDRREIERLLKHPRAAVLGASADSVLIADAPQPRLLRRPVAGHVNPYQPILLGLEDGEPLFAADLDDPEAESQLAETGAGRLVSLREAGLLLPQPEGGVAAYLVALLNWHRRHRFCANCGARTRVSEAGLSRRCPSCSQSHFPRTDPVVIMLVDDGAGHVLLGRRIGWADGRFSILAGYVAPGETPEAAVEREVLEESGIRAHSARYVASQPWPFPASLMLGYEASAERNGSESGARAPARRDGRGALVQRRRGPRGRATLGWPRRRGRAIRRSAAARRGLDRTRADRCLGRARWPPRRSAGGLSPGWVAGQDRLQRRDVAVECLAALSGQCDPYPAPLVFDVAIDGDIAGLLERRELLGQRRIRHLQAVSDKGEVGPVGRSQQRDYRKPRARMDELVEARLDRRFAYHRSARRRMPATSDGPPA